MDSKKLFRLLSPLLLMLLISIGFGQDGTTLGQVGSQFQRTRIVGTYTGVQFVFQNTISGGTSGLSWTDRCPVFANTNCTDLQFVWMNGYLSSSGLIVPVGSPHTFKPYFESGSNLVPIPSQGFTSSAMACPARSSGDTVSSSTGTAATFTASAVTNLVVGQVLSFPTSATTASIQAVNSSTKVVSLSASILTTSGESVNIIGNPGQSTTIPDGSWIVSNPLPVYMASGSHTYVRMYHTLAAGQNSCLTFPSSYVGGFNTTSSIYGGSDTTQQDDTYSFGTAGSTSTGSAYTFGPVAVIGRQLTPTPVVGLVGDSICYGNAAHSYFGYLGDAMSAGGIAFYNMGLNGASSINLGLYASLTFFLSRYVDYIVYEAGVNDLANNATLAQMQSYLKQAALMYCANGQTMYVCALTPRDNSTDFWATYTNQSLASWETVREGYNNWVRDPRPTGMVAQVNAYLKSMGSLGQIGGFIDAVVPSGAERTSTGAMVTLDSNGQQSSGGYWYTNGTASAIVNDGIHPTTLETNAMNPYVNVTPFKTVPYVPYHASLTTTDLWNLRIAAKNNYAFAY